MTLRVGLTGGIGCGKSTVSNLFSQLGVPVIDADIIAKELTAPGTPIFQAIVNYFGDTIVTEDGRLDRRALRNIVFRHPAAKRWLEQHLHPIIRQRMRDQLALIPASTPYCVVVIPLINPSHKGDVIDVTLVVHTSPEQRKIRVKQRDHTTTEIIAAIMKSQMKPEAFLDCADHIINNDGSLLELKKQVHQLDRHYRQLKKPNNDHQK